MNQNRTGRNHNNDNNEGAWNRWGTAAVIGGGIAAALGGWYLLSGSNKSEEEPSAITTSPQAASRDGACSRRTTSDARPQPERQGNTGSDQSNGNMTDYVAGLIKRINMDGGSSSCRRGVPRGSVPENPVINNIDSLLHDIYVRYVALNDEDFEYYYGVVDKIFLQLHQKMKEVDPYYNKYSSTVQFAGSHPDRLRINKPDEFDIDIVIGLPLSIKNNPLNPAESDFIIEPQDPGFVQLKMGVQYDRLPFRDVEEWQINRTAYEWKDEKNYLLRSKFSDWFKSVVNRALNEFVENITLPPVFYVAGVPYTVKKSESGPAMTMYIENTSKNFKLDVDLVPALRFPIDRWPVCCSYRNVPAVSASRTYWMVVPKPNKGGATEHDRRRSWRVALHEQEREIMHDTRNMRQAIRLLKKLRDAQKMDKIASYYIKTMFFWVAIEHQTDREFWNQSPAILFNLMLKNFHQALVSGRIPYFWNKNNNLIGQVDRTTLNIYAKKVGELLEILEQPRAYKQAAKYLLTPAEFEVYNEKYLHI